MKIYLAGRCRGQKIKLVPRGERKSNYVASDLSAYGNALRQLSGLDYDDFMHGDRGEHKWPYTDHCGTVSRKEIVREFAEPLIYTADLMIAYIDDSLAYGTIAEIGMANARETPVVMLKLLPPCFSPQATQAERISHFDAIDAMDDAYWFVSSLSNVRMFESDKLSDFQHIVRQIDQVESPIELNLYLELFNGHSDLALNLHTQYKVDKYRLDFAFPDCKLAIECDGHDYHSTRDQRGRDADRDRELTLQGWSVIRFTGSQIHKNAEKCADDVIRIYYARARAATKTVTA